MAGPNYVLDKGYLAESTLTRFRAVKFGTTFERCTAATAAGEAVIGVVQEPVAADKAGKQVADVRMMGITKMEAAGAITLGAKVRTAADGRATPLAGTAGVNENVVGTALQPAAAAGDLIDVFLTMFTLSNAATT